MKSATSRNVACCKMRIKLGRQPEKTTHPFHDDWMSSCPTINHWYCRFIITQNIYPSVCPIGRPAAKRSHQDREHLFIHSKLYKFFKKNPLVQSPCNPRVLLGLHGDSTKGFLLKNLYCLERIVNMEWADFWPAQLPICVNPILAIYNASSCLTGVCIYRRQWLSVKDCWLAIELFHKSQPPGNILMRVAWQTHSICLAA